MGGTAQTAEIVEIAALGVASGGQAFMLWREHLSKRKDFKVVETNTHGVASSKSNNIPQALSVPRGVHFTWITLPLLLAAIARAFADRRARRGSQYTPSSIFLSRLHAIESGIERENENRADSLRKLDKIQTRSRLVSRDVREQIKQLQAASTHQGEILMATTMKLEEIDSNIKDIEDLSASMQVLAAKQFELLQSVISRVKKLDERLPRTLSRTEQHSSSSQNIANSTVAVKEKNEECENVGKKDKSISSRQGSNPTANPATKSVDPLQSIQTSPSFQPEVTDEWGRKKTPTQIKKSKEQNTIATKSSSTHRSDEIMETQSVQGIVSDSHAVTLDSGPSHSRTAPSESIKENDDGTISFSF